MPDTIPPSLETLLSGNQSFADRFSREEPALLKELAVGQHPKVLWIGCADSRVPESLICNAKPGDIFVHRNIAASFPPSDQSALAALAYAVNHLHVEHVIVCGHYACGGVAGAWSSCEHRLPCSPTNAMPEEGEEAISKWLAPIRALAVAQRRLQALAQNPLTLEKSQALLVESHVSATVSNIAQSSVVQNAWRKGVPLSIHGWVYSVESGRLIDLKIEEGRWNSNQSSNGGTKVFVAEAH